MHICISTEIDSGAEWNLIWCLLHHGGLYVRRYVKLVPGTYVVSHSLTIPVSSGRDFKHPLSGVSSQIPLPISRHLSAMGIVVHSPNRQLSLICQFCSVVRPFFFLFPSVHSAKGPQVDLAILAQSMGSWVSGDRFVRLTFKHSVDLHASHTKTASTYSS